MLKIANSKMRHGAAFATTLFAGVALINNSAHGITQDVSGDADSCNNSGIVFQYGRKDYATVCQSTGDGYRLSQWVYYSVETEHLPTEKVNGKDVSYIPAIGPAFSYWENDKETGNGITGERAAQDGWLKVDADMSDCIVENGGFWRRGYFQYKESPSPTWTASITYKDKTLSAYQKGIAPIGFTGKTDATKVAENYISDGFILNGNTHSFKLGQQVLYWREQNEGADKNQAWASIDTSKGWIDDKKAEELLQSFPKTKGNPEHLNNTESIFPGGDKEFTALFCYSDGSPYNGMVKIGNSASSFAYHKKNYGSASEKGKNNKVGDNTINLGVVHVQKYVPGYVFMGLSKDPNKSGRTSYEATMTLDGAIQYSYKGTKWESSDSAHSNNTEGNVSSDARPEFTLHKGDNTICINLEYKEKQGDSSNQKLQACGVVTYEPATADVYSDTLGTIESKYLASGNTKTNYSSHEAGDADREITFDPVKVNAGPIKLTWSNYLGYKNLTGTTPVNTKYSINSPLLGQNTTIGAYSSSGSSGPAISAYTYETNTIETGAFPGETHTEWRSIYHPSKVTPSTGAAAAGAETKKSSVVLKLRADDLQCGYDDAHMYNIGVDNAKDYLWLSMRREDNAKVTVGSGMNDQANMWLNPANRIQITQTACFGSQIGIDARDRGDGKNRWVLNPWTEIEDHVNNTVFSLGGAGYAAIRNTNVFTREGSANSISSQGGSSFYASEVGSKPTDRISKGYKLEATSNEGPKSIGNLGKNLQLTFSSPDGQSASINAKIPYNYILEPKVSIGSSGIVTLGNSSTFTITINNNDTRTNEKVQSTPYHTNVKPNTSARYLKFAANTETTTPELLQSINGMFIPGDHTGDIAIATGLSDIKNPESGTISGLLPSGAIKSSEQSIKVSSDIAEDGYNKICVALAVYPADSHNSTDPVINDDDQSAALTDEFGGAFTRISVACKTVGKYPSASVEGNGIVTGSIITGSRTEYGGRSFGSWTEYGLVANSVVNIASGASSAYDNPQTSRNASVSYDGAGLKIGDFDSIQTLGNMNSGIGARNDAKLYAAQARTYANNVIATFFTGEASSTCVLGSSYDSCTTFVNANYNDDVVINSDFAGTINDAANNGHVIIYSKRNIKISNAVTELNATLIADDRVDTCEEADQGGDNEQLLYNCSNSLFINGIVYSEKPIALDRIYGGGSVDGMNLDANTLMQRAEILNYDPKIVKWSYDYKRQTQPLTTTYIEELSTRY